MTSKTFKSVTDNEGELDVRANDCGVFIAFSRAGQIWQASTFAPSDAPALALAILEAAMHGGGHDFGSADPVSANRVRFMSESELDRFIAKIKAEAKAEALRDAADTLNPELINYRRDAMEALSQPIRPAGGDSAMSLQLALVAANRTAVWLRARANQYKEEA
ncbi:hypothetical protein [Glutamicibacter ardleyensis]|uniref:hypothetical protein n=1 Tax=Glutamicibacter ardleyensis TaxID=225894 RepID=UPI003FD36F62